MTVPPDVKYSDRFVDFQKQAIKDKAGLWADNKEKPNDRYNKTSRTEKKQNKPTNKTDKIKGNINSKGEKIYHVPGGAYYERTKAEEYFETEEDAVKAGYRRSKR